MSWTFEQIQKGTVGSTPTDICFDGRDVWVSYGTSVKVFSYWDVNSDYEYLDASYYEERNTNALYEVTTLNTGAVQKMTYWDGKMYLLNSPDIDVWDVTTKTQVDTLTVPFAAQPVLTAGNNRIWACSSAVDSSTDQQYIMMYNIITDSWTSVLITGRKQFLNRDIIHGLDGFVYITAHNDHAIVEVDASTAAMLDVHRINRHPYKLHVNQAKTVYVASDAGSTALQGMISTFDQTSEVVTSFSSAGGSLESFYDDEVGGKVWMIGGNVKLGRLNKSDNDFRYTQGTAPGFTILLSDFTGATPSTITRGVVTPQLFYQRWNGSGFDDVTVRPYVFFCAGTNVFAARATAMVRVNSVDVLGTAMIATKAQNYYGDLT